MSFENALSTLLDKLIWVLMFPEWLLIKLPSKRARLAFEAKDNWRKYMHELFSEKKIEAREGLHTEGMDIMGTLVKSAYGEKRPDANRTGSPGRAEKGQAGKTVALTDSEIFGNAFVMILAGHETTANSIFFSLVELAISPGSQRSLQNEIQIIFGDTDPKDWNYDTSINQLLGGMAGAVLNEELRLMPPVINIPKSVRKNQDQVLSIDGKKIVLPKGAHINLNTIGTHRNPKYWPSRGPSKVSDRSDDLYDFVPERWLIKETVGTDDSRNGRGTANQPEEDQDALGGFTGSSSHESLFRPAPGAFIPFSDGARSCLGRRLAQIEVVAVLSTIYQKYSVELAVDEWASDEEVAKMNVEQKKELYAKAQKSARAMIRTATTIITLKLHTGQIPLRIVKKGDERFINLID